MATIRTLVIADTDPQIDIPKTVKKEKIDLVITLGDLTIWDLEGLDKVEVPKIGVYGNHDVVKYMPQFGIEDLHCKTWNFMGLKFAGFEGCPEYRKHKVEPMYSQREAKDLIRKIPHVDVFIAHCPPTNVNDDETIHKGWIELENYLAHENPKMLLHGHTYPNPDKMTTQYYDTKIVYVQGYKIVEIEA